MTWKIINISDVGTSIRFGGNDLDKVSQLFSAVDVDDVDINADWTFRSGKLYLKNPAGTFSYNIIPAAIAADRQLNIPLITGTDTLAVLGLAQTFTAKQTIQRDGSSDILDLYRTDNTVTSGVDLDFDLEDSTNASTTYARVRGEIVDNTNTSEDGKIEFHTMKAGTLTRQMQLLDTGILLCGGPNTRVGFSESGLTGQNIYTFPNSSEEVLGRDSVQSPKNKTFTVGYGNTGGNIFNGITLENPYLTTETGATVIRTGFFHACGSTTSDGILNAGITAIASTSSTDKSATEGIGFQYTTGAVANANAGLRWTTTLFRRDWGSYVILRIHPSSTSDIRCFVGFSSDTNEIAGETTLNNFSGAGVGKRTGDTNWFTMRNDGDATEDRVDTGVAFAASPVTIELALNTTNFRSRIGSTENTAQTTELPATTTNLGLHVEIETGAGAADKNIIIYPIYARLGAI